MSEVGKFHKTGRNVKLGNFNEKCDHVDSDSSNRVTPFHVISRSWDSIRPNEILQVETIFPMGVTFDKGICTSIEPINESVSGLESIFVALKS